MDLAAVLDICQSSISDAKRRDSIPADWYMKLYEKFGINPNWLKKGEGPQRLRTDQNYEPVDLPKGGLLMEEKNLYGDPLAKGIVTPVYSMFCRQDSKNVHLDMVGHLSLPQPYAGSEITVLRVDTEACVPTARKGAFIGINTTQTSPMSGELFAVVMPHEGIVLKRLYLDIEKEGFILRSDAPEHPENFLSAAECRKRLLGRVAWVFQTL